MIRTLGVKSSVVRLTLFLTLMHVVVWSLHVLSYAAVPARNMIGTHNALFYSALYVIACSVASLLTAKIWTDTYGCQAEVSRSLIDLLASPALVVVFCILSVVGLGFHYYDKLIINHLSGACLADLRTAWISSTVARGRTLSSWQSALGHILSHAAFPLLFVFFVSGHRLPRWLRITGWWVAVPSVLLYAVIIGTRTTILSFVGLAIIAAIVSLSLAGRDEWRGQAKKVSAAFAIVLATAVLYAAAVSADRMYCHGGPDRYVEQFVPELSAEFVGTMPESDIGKLATLLGLYLSHSSWTFEKSLEFPQRSGSVFLNFAWYWLFRLGIVDAMPSGIRPYQHGMMSLTGAAWYDFDLTGMVLVSILHGVLIAVAAVLLSRGGFSQAAGALVYVCIGLVTVWAPLAFAPNTLSYPFIGLAFLVYFCFAWVIALSNRFAQAPNRSGQARAERLFYKGYHSPTV